MANRRYYDEYLDDIKESECKHEYEYHVKHLEIYKNRYKKKLAEVGDGKEETSLTTADISFDVNMKKIIIAIAKLNGLTINEDSIIWEFEDKEITEVDNGEEETTTEGRTGTN